MKVERTEEVEKIEGMCSNHPYITSPGKNSEKREYFLLKHEGYTIGCGYIQTFFKKIGSMGALFIKENWRGQGAGEYLEEKMEERLEEKGAKICLIGIHRENEISLNLHKKRGYHTIIEELGENTFKKTRVRKVLEKISPKPLPENTVMILGKRLGVEKGSTHPLKEFYDLEKYLESIGIEKERMPRMSKKNKITNFMMGKDIISLLNSVFGIYSIFLFIQGRFTAGSSFLILAVTMDVLDGEVARRISKPTEFGKRIDIADLVSFGAAPAILLLTWLNPQNLVQTVLLHASALSILIAEVLRLARFQTREPNGKHFIGLPGTATGVLYPVIYFLSPGFYPVILITFLISLLMVSHIKFPIEPVQLEEGEEKEECSA